MTAWNLSNCRRLQDVAGETLRPGGLALTRQLLGFGQFSAGSRILDAGCGLGATLRYLTQDCRLTAVGVDCAGSLLAAARKQSSTLPLVCAALENLPFAAASFDAIICECVLSQTPVKAPLAEFSRVVRGGGLLLLSDLYRKAEALKGAPGLATKEQITIMLAATGFKVVHWEDRTRDLRQLAAQLIMASGSASDNLFGWSNHAGCGDKETMARQWQDVGYHLLVARREG